MKIVLISDLHSQPKTLAYVEKILALQRPDALIVSGDITTRDDVKFLNDLITIVRRRKTELCLIWGNSDEENVQEAVESSGYSIHLKKRVIDNIGIYGVSETDSPILPDSSAIAGSILVTHRPPLARMLSQKYSGSPRFHISGHIHSRASVKTYPATTHIQVPTLQDGRYAVLDMDRNKVDFFRV